MSHTGPRIATRFTYDANMGFPLTYKFSVNGSNDLGTLTWNTNGTLSKLVVADSISGTSDSQTLQLYL